MHRLLYLLTILTVISCNYASKPIDNDDEHQEKPKKTIATCFADVDTSSVGESIGCSGGIYKLINDNYVIHLIHDFPVQFDSCYSVNIDGSNADRMTELFVFDNENANLSNICTDLIITNNPQPTRRLQAESGHLIIGFSDPTELYGNRTHRTTILIKRIVFVDKKTGEKFEFENELCWKVLDIGTPG